MTEYSPGDRVVLVHHHQLIQKMYNQEQWMLDDPIVFPDIYGETATVVEVSELLQSLCVHFDEAGVWAVDVDPFVPFEWVAPHLMEDK